MMKMLEKSWHTCLLLVVILVSSNMIYNKMNIVEKFENQYIPLHFSLLVTWKTRGLSSWSPIRWGIHTFTIQQYLSCYIILE